MSAEATDTGGAGDSPPEIQNVAVADTNVLTNHLKHVVSVLLEGEDQPSVNLKSCLDSKEYQESLRKFISDPQTRALFIQRQSMKGAGFNHLFSTLIRVFSCDTTLKTQILSLLKALIY
jgi:hypothetical protein